MRQFHLFEFIDLPWLPKPFRDGITDLINYGQNKFHIYAPIYPLLFETLEKLNQKNIVSLCSGAGGPIESISKEVKKRSGENIQITLTDLFPNFPAFEMLKKKFPENIDYTQEPVDATKTGDALIGFRTLFTAFHHFRPQDAKKILQDAVRNNQGIGIFEYTERATGAMLMIIIGTILGFFLTPFFKPFRWSRIIFTYLIPVILPLTMFDGLVSCLRTYTPEELTKMTQGLSENYEWKIGRIKSPFVFTNITYLIGHPKI